jgi:hypothetical protein
MRSKSQWLPRGARRPQVLGLLALLALLLENVQILTPEELLQGGRNKKSAALDSGSDDEVCVYIFFVFMSLLYRKRV